MPKCEYCGKKQDVLNACNVFVLWLCDLCYGTTLNPYLREPNVIDFINHMERIIEWGLIHANNNY